MRYHLSLNILAMGALNSVDVAQIVYENVLHKAGCLDPRHHMQFGKPVPRGRLWEGLYADDHLILAIVPKSDVAKPIGADPALLAALRAHYKKTGWPLSGSKALSFATTFTAWGTEVRSEKGRVGAPLERRAQLFMLTLLVLVAPGVTKALMQSILGSFVQPFYTSKGTQ